jgi:RNA polymerase primary sigma factor
MMRNLQITSSITNRTSVVEKYFDEIGKVDMCTAQEEVLLAERIRNGDLAALEKLTKANLRFVVSVAKKYQFQGLPLADLINEGNVGLIKAAHRFDETRGFKFISFAVWWIRQSIIAAITENARMIRLPVNKINEIIKINKAITTIEQYTCREPLAEQIAEHLNMATDRVTEVLSQASWTVTIDAVFGDEEYSLLDKIPSDDFPVDNALMAESFSAEISAMLSTLPCRERTIIELSFGLINGIEMVPADIAPILDLSTERVRQLKTEALLKLRKFKNLN